MSEEAIARPSLKRALGLWLLTLYGIGVTIGAGIYVLIGAVAQAAGPYAPLSFLLAGLVALFTALSFAELSVRFPWAGGEAVYAEEAFRSKAAAPIVGLLVLSAGIVSAGTITLGAAGYLHELVGLPEPAGAAIILALLALLAASGIERSVYVAGAITLLEVGGLLLVCVLALAAEPGAHVSAPPLDLGRIASGMVAGAALSFFAFIGFEDMVNVAEEVKDPGKTLPRAIILTLLISTVLYLLVAFAAVRAVAPEDLAASSAPLALVAERSGALGGRIIGTIAVIAALNGILVQIIMGSRLIYGLARRGHAPAFLSAVHALTQTPIVATLLFSVVVGVFAISFPITRLATGATQILLTIFLTMNIALITLKLRDGSVRPVFRVPLAVPLIGAISALALLAASFFV